eukprot:gene10021-biopygen4028
MQHAQGREEDARNSIQEHATADGIGRTLGYDNRRLLPDTQPMSPCLAAAQVAANGLLLRVFGFTGRQHALRVCMGAATSSSPLPADCMIP